MYIPKGCASSPTVSKESIIFTSIADAEEERKSAVIDIPNVFFHTRVKKKTDMAIIKICGILVDILCNILSTYKP